MKLFYEQFDEDDVEPDADDDQHKIAEQLDAAMQRAAGEGDVPVQKKTRGEAETKSNEYRSNIRRDRHKSQVYIVLMQDKIEAEPVHHDVQRRTETSAGRIPERLHRHDPAEWRIKEIYKGYDPLFH